MQRYVIKFEAWTSGNFICYLINSHKNFPSIKKESIKYVTESNNAKHYKLPSVMFDGMNVVDNPGKYVHEINYTKICTIAKPHWNEKYHREGAPNFVDDTLHEYSVKRIILTLSENVAPDIARRIIDNTSPNELSLMREIMASLEQDYKGKYDFISICSNEILQCNEDEYLKLCNFIEEDPLDDWKDIVHSYMEEFIRV